MSLTSLMTTLFSGSSTNNALSGEQTPLKDIKDVGNSIPPPITVTHIYNNEDDRRTHTMASEDLPEEDEPRPEYRHVRVHYGPSKSQELCH